MQCRGPGFSQSKRSARNTRGGSGHFHASRVLCAKHRTQQINHLAVIWRVAPPLPKARPVRKNVRVYWVEDPLAGRRLNPGWFWFPAQITWASICTCQPCQLTQYIDLYIHDWRYGYIYIICIMQPHLRKRKRTTLTAEEDADPQEVEDSMRDISAPDDFDLPEEVEGHKTLINTLYHMLITYCVI